MKAISPIDSAVYQHGQPAKTGILLTNLGTPDAPETGALRQYLKQFLSDPRIVEMPRLLWWPILYGFILPIRPQRSAQAYAKVWTQDGSPLLHIAKQQAQAVQAYFQDRAVVALGMRYGNPSIDSALEQLKAANVDKLIVLPLYPQYSAAATASTFDAVSKKLASWRWIPELHFLNHYHDNPLYISALAASVQSYWQTHGKGEKVLFSFHGIPKSTMLAGDPYYCQCLKTSRLLAEALGLVENDWETVFQSRFGKQEWLKPYADRRLAELGASKMTRVDVLCPGFSADCLETLEEIAISFKGVFQQAGGGEFHYIPALNNDSAHIEMMNQILAEQL